MDKQFARILMLSVLLPAGASLAEAIEHDHSLPVRHEGFASQFVNDSSADSMPNKSVEFNPFMELVAAEQHAVVRQRGR